MPALPKSLPRRTMTWHFSAPFRFVCRTVDPNPPSPFFPPLHCHVQDKTAADKQASVSLALPHGRAERRHWNASSVEDSIKHAGCHTHSLFLSHTNTHCRSPSLLLPLSTSSTSASPPSASSSASYTSSCSSSSSASFAPSPFAPRQ